MKKKKKKLPTLASLKRKADVAFSIFIRTQDVARDGTTACVTCGVRKPWREQQCGHFVSRVYLATRFNIVNAHAQCGACNVLRRGNMVAYSSYMIQTYGVRIIDSLLFLRSKTVKFSRGDYEEMIERFNKSAEENLHGN